MKNAIQLFAYVLVLLIIGNQTVNAWECETCNGKIHNGMRSSKTFTLNRCSISSGSARGQAVISAMKEWNSLDGMADRFSFQGSSSSTDCTVTTGNDTWSVAYADLDGDAGLSKKRNAPCLLPYSDGRLLECDVFIDSGVSTSPQGILSPTIGAQEVAMHEFGHCLGQKHENDTPSVMCSNAPTCGKIADSNYKGNQASRHAETIWPDDADFGFEYHSSSNTGQIDPMVSAWRHQNGAMRRIYDASPIYTKRAGQTANVTFTYGNKGKLSIPSSNPIKCEIVLSTDKTISTDDRNVKSFSFWAGSGSLDTTTYTITIPNIAAKTYYVGVVADRNN